MMSPLRSAVSVPDAAPREHSTQKTLKGEDCECLMLMLERFHSQIRGQPFFAKTGFPAPLPKKLLAAVFVELRSSQNRLFFTGKRKPSPALGFG